METLHICRLTLSIILHGNPDSTTSENKILFNAVSKYVRVKKIWMYQLTIFQKMFYEFKKYVD